MGFFLETTPQHRLTANSGHCGEKCYFRDQLKNNKADKIASLLPPLALNKTVAKHMKNRMLKILSIISLILFSYSSYSQKDVYFLINEDDTMIEKQISEKPNSYTGYEIFYDKKVLVEKNNTPEQDNTKATGIIKVWVEDTKYDYYVYENPSVSFSFIKEFDKLITKKELIDLEIITDRRHFLEIGNNGSFDLLGHNYYFLEKRKDGKFLKRKVHPVIFE